ncbi:MAG: hypothetical protein QOI63_506 [Thermoplasmata archaeon]|nr:hypothetical protein [Thermoplasmata archaeon]
MLRILLAGTLLAAAALAALPPASASSVCDIFVDSPYYNQTLGLACVPADCVLDQPILACPGVAAGYTIGYALCYGTTGPLFWAPACT